MSVAPALVAEDVQVVLGGVPVVDGVSFTVGPGDWLTIVGANGAGKSTLLRAIAGLVRNSGRILLDGRDAAALSQRERARCVALVAQAPVAPVGLSVADYVLLGRTPHVSPLAWPGRGDEKIVAESLAALDLVGFSSRPLVSLSGGERQRAFLARALAQRAPIVLLDEPTTSLDIGHQQQVLEVVDRLRRDEGLTVITTMHDLTLAGQYADEILLLAGGRTVASGAPDAVFTETNLATHYGARVRVVHEGGQAFVLPYRAGADPRPEA